MTDAKQPTLIKGAIVLTMDSAVGDFLAGDVLVEGGTITRVAASVPAPEGAAIVDGQGKIVIPGLVNCHMHTW